MVTVPQVPGRLPLFAIAGISLVAGVWVGLLRLGWELPQPPRPFPAAHGPLMVSAFLGTLIALERAVALGKKWTYGAPLFAALGALSALFLPPSWMAPAFLAAGSAFLVAIFISLYLLQPASFFIVIGTGAVLWLVGNSLWAAALPLHRVAPWWIGFLVLTIAGERLELSRVLRLSRWDSAKLLLGIALLLCGLITSLSIFETGIKICGVGLLIIGLWLSRYDMAQRTIAQRGLPRFMAVSLLAGYGWLVVGGLIWIAFARDFSAGPLYDAMLHAIFLGFVFSMIFAHAPIIFPSITGMAMVFDRGFYSHLGLLHFALALRIVGDLAENLQWQQWGGMLNAAAVLLFLANNLRAIRGSRATPATHS